MPKEVRTNVVISAETKGFDAALQSVLKVNKESLESLKVQAKSYEDAQKNITGLQTKVSQLAKVQANLQQTMMGTKDKSSNAYKALAQSLKNVRRESEDLEDVVKNLERAYMGEARAAKELERANEQLMRREQRRQDQAREQARRAEDQQRQEKQHARWAGTQGFMQTALPGMAPLFMQRGPGMWRQAAGMAMGAPIGMAMRGMGALAQMPFAGAQGMANVVSQMPMGGILGGVMGSAIGQAGRYMEYQRMGLAAAPYMGTAMGNLQLNREAGAARAVSLAGQTRGLGVARGAEGAMRNLERMGGAGALVPFPRMEAPENYVAPTQAATNLGGVQMQGSPQAMLDQRWGNVQLVRGALEQATYRAPRAREAAAMARIRRRRAQLNAPRAQITGMGERYGMAAEEALQQSMGMVQAGGGYLGEAQQQGMLETSMAARTLFGMEAGTSGAFLQAGRRGGMVGAQGNASQALTRTLADGLRLGLSGSEMTQYMQMMAEGIKQWETTGIPIAPEAIQSMATEFSKAGISGTRAATMARGVAGYVQGIGAQGPQGGLDLMMLQAFGGYKGGGAADYEQAVMRMEEMGGRIREGGVGAVGQDQEMAGVFRQLIKMGGGGATGRFFLRGQLGKRMGIQMSQKEVALLEKQLTGQALTPEEQQSVQQEASRRAGGAGLAGAISAPGGLAGAAQGMVPGNLRAQAAIQNKQLAAGASMVKIVNDLDSAAASMTKTFASLVGDNGVVSRLTQGMENLAQSVEKLAGKNAGWRDYVDAIRNAVGS